MQNHDANAQAIGDWLDDLVNWIVTADHTGNRLARIIEFPEGTTPDINEEQMRRMTDEYNMIDAVCRVLGDTQRSLQGLGVLSLTYEQQLVMRINTLMHPNTARMVQAYASTVYLSTSLQKHPAKTISEMFEKLAVIRLSYAHLMTTPQSGSR
jgi:hypothetical protein